MVGELRPLAFREVWAAARAQAFESTKGVVPRTLSLAGFGRCRLLVWSMKAVS